MEKCQPENAFPSSERAMATQQFTRHLPPKLVQDTSAPPWTTDSTNSGPAPVCTVTGLSRSVD